MYKKLEELWEEIKNNKDKGQGFCKDCPLKNKKYLGPCAINQEGEDLPKIVIVSESPTKPKRGGNTIEEIQRNWYDEWKRWKSKKKESSKWPGKLLPFLFKLTDGKLLSTYQAGLVTNPEIYWTHTMKCFIQECKEGIRKIKKDPERKFDRSVKSCAGYLEKELDILKDAKNFIAIGRVASDNIEEWKKNMKVKIEGEFWEVIHPSAPNTRKNLERKNREYPRLKARIQNILLKKDS